MVNYFIFKYYNYTQIYFEIYLNIKGIRLGLLEALQTILQMLFLLKVYYVIFMICHNIQSEMSLLFLKVLLIVMICMTIKLKIVVKCWRLEKL